MARGHPGIPKVTPTVFKKIELLRQLRSIDNDDDAKARVLVMETGFRTRMQLHVESLPPSASKFEKFSTNPFVLMMHCMKKGYNSIQQIEADILPAKLFSSMETSAGKMAELVTLPIYGWDTDAVMSGMHSSNSNLDGRKIEGDLVRLATLKSGPQCLNDGMSANIANSIIDNVAGWAADAEARRVEFTYGVLYGTPKKSNKKDWHILRNLDEKLPAGAMIQGPNGRWSCSFEHQGLEISVAIRIGADWWSHLAQNQNCFIELCVALIRACVVPSTEEPEPNDFIITDLHHIVSIENIPETFNVALLQRSQLEWLLFLSRHFADELEEFPSSDSSDWAF